MYYKITLLILISTFIQAQSLRKMEIFKDTIPSAISKVTSGTNDTYYSSQWNLAKINASGAWDISTGNPSIIIAIIDNGVQSNHPDLNDHLVTGYDVINNDNITNPWEPNSYEQDYHGTACAGIASAETNNGIGIAGVAYNCKIMPIQFTHSMDFSNSTNFSNGIRWAVDHGASIINFSGNTTDDPAVNQAIDYATSVGRNGKGCIIVKSSGSKGVQDITFPGRHAKVISVGATDQNDVRRNDSNYGPELDVMAPGGVYATPLLVT